MAQSFFILTYNFRHARYARAPKWARTGRAPLPREILDPPLPGPKKKFQRNCLTNVKQKTSKAWPVVQINEHEKVKGRNTVSFIWVNVSFRVTNYTLSIVIYCALIVNYCYH